MAAELRLGVSFDLVYFRQQLQKLGRIASSEFTAPIKIKLDRRVIDKELNDLQRLIKRRKYNIELNITGGLRKQTFDDLQARLDALSTRKKVEIPVSIKNAATAKDVNDTVIGIKSRIAQNQTVKQGDGKIRIGTSIKPSITNADVADFRRVVQAKLSGISVKVKADIQGGFASGPTGLAGLQEYMRTQGLSGGNMPGAAQTGRRTQFEAAVAQASNRELQDMMRRAKVQGRSSIRSSAAMRERLMQLDDAAMESVLGNLQMNMNDPRRVKRGFLDQVARAVFWMAGVDPEYLKRQAAQRRALPGVDFPATVPPSRVSIGPSGTGRALPAGAIPGALPGTAFGARGFLPPQLGQDLQNILRNAAFTFVDSLNARIRQVNVREIGRQALPPSMIRGLLPSAVGRTPATYGGPADRGSFIQNRIAQAYARSALRGASVMAESPQGFALGAGGSGTAGPYRPFAQPERGGALVLSSQRGGAAPATELPKNYLEIGKAIKGLDPILQKSKVPFSGAIRELGDEFATATKQVLLYGTAYKALAFLTSLPGQAFEAAKGLQTINNQLEAVTGSSAAADRSFAFIDGLANRFNVPLASARDGFVKLYASMEPAGFATGEIENLFEGISKATATFGLSADQVDRVNYAFAQMASKGQIMSEELKGQLGDVLPGSLALFARAAQMSIPEFSKAMEDGAFKGEAMAQVLRNVAKIMNSDFGGAAANAANTLQGALNGLQNSVQRMYEAFEPVVDIAAANIFPVISQMVNDATSAIQAFGMEMKGIGPATSVMSDGALDIYNALQLAADTFDTVITVAKSLGSTFQVLGNIISGALQVFNAIVGNPIGEFFVKLAVNIGIATAAIRLFASAAVANAVQQLGLFLGNIKLTIAALRTLITTSRAAKIAVGGIVAGTVMVGLEMLVTRIAAAKDETDKLRKAALGAADALRAMSDAQLFAQERTIKDRIQKIETLQAQAGGRLSIKNPSAMQVQMAKELGLPITGRAGQSAISMVRAEGERQNLLAALNRTQYESKSRTEQAVSGIVDLEKVDLAPGKGEKGKKKSLDDLIGGDIKRRLDEAKAALEYDIQVRLGAALDDEDAQRMIKYYEQYRKSALELLAVQETIAQVNKFAPQLIANGIDPTEKLADLKAKEKELFYDIMTISQKHTNDAAKAAKKREEELRKEAEKRQEILRLIEDAQIASGQITPRQAAVIQQRRGFEADIARAEESAPDLVPQLKAAQAQIPEAGSLAELYKNTKDELDSLTDSTKLLGEAANGIGSAFAKSFTDILTGAQTWQEGLGNAFQSVASMFADMVAQMLAKWAAMQIIGMFLPGASGPGAASPMASAARGTPGAIAPNGAPYLGPAFANGGVVTGPTLGLVGEGRFNEAVVPLPDGRKIPVELGGGAGNNISTNIVVNMNNGQASSQMSGGGGQALGRELEGAVRNVILKESRPGGLIYSGR
ncbi:tail length tape measure protein [Synechococcus phage S-CBS4]|uniref:tail length tape measure protein n=1 Tax=Synechococcus phage S-CBS4 TaxID=756275 RepID=UPI000246A6FA|nr:tail length tape measure protein [Synechococcus phage S-CBS4]AEX56001.1 tail length tape measure protein [Synechococcus phage S-CBS4]AGN30520.1 hypothetical protein SXAG_00073 [Synechococcus phage S-CBS4]